MTFILEELSQTVQQQQLEHPLFHMHQHQQQQQPPQHFLHQR